ncbi:MAG TPA: hypothetical protein VN155_16795 [Devosia sp.]|nr:hypothetical protein [Devosia sp.]
MTNPVSRVTDELISDIRDLIRVAWVLCDNTANENPPEVDQQDWDALSKALDKLDQLPTPPDVIAGPAAKVEYALRALSSNSEGEAVAQMIGPWDMEGDCIVWLEGCERLSAGDLLYTRPQPQQVEVSDEMVERAARGLHEASSTHQKHEVPWSDLSAQRRLWFVEDARAALTAALRSDQK